MNGDMVIVDRKSIDKKVEQMVNGYMMDGGWVEFWWVERGVKWVDKKEWIEMLGFLRLDDNDYRVKSYAGEKENRQEKWKGDKDEHWGFWGWMVDNERKEKRDVEWLDSESSVIWDRYSF